MKKLNLLAAALLVSGMATAQINWSIDKNHSNIGFSVTHMMVSESTGNFKEFEGTVASKSDDFVGSEVTFVAKTASIDTDNENRDKHLKSDDFFSAEKFPEIKFKGNIVKEGGKYLLKGDFTMKDVTKPVTFDVIYRGTVGNKAGFKLTGIINRFDYGLKWDRALEAGGLVVGQDVTIACNIELNKPKDAAAGTK
jgi:polyisoprenoid-binding protein YceI